MQELQARGLVQINQNHLLITPSETFEDEDFLELTTVAGSRLDEDILELTTVAASPRRCGRAPFNVRAGARSFSAPVRP